LDPDSAGGSLILFQEGENDTHKKKKIVLKNTSYFDVLDVLFLEAGGFSCSFEVLHGGLRIIISNVLDQKISI
jgi:hypothetical protein